MQMSRLTTPVSQAYLIERQRLSTPACCSSNDLISLRSEPISSSDGRLHVKQESTSGAMEVYQFPELISYAGPPPPPPPYRPMAIKGEGSECPSAHLSHSASGCFGRMTVNTTFRAQTSPDFVHNGPFSGHVSESATSSPCSTVSESTPPHIASVMQNFVYHHSPEPASSASSSSCESHSTSYSSLTPSFSPSPSSSSSSSLASSASTGRQSVLREVTLAPEAVHKMAHTTPGCGTGGPAKTKQYACEAAGCGKRFARVDELKRHQRTHSDQRPFPCTLCDKAFTRSDHLTTHRRTHTGEKPYKCDLCERQFARSDERARHKKTHGRPRRAGRRPKNKEAGVASTLSTARSTPLETGDTMSPANQPVGDVEPCQTQTPSTPSVRQPAGLLPSLAGSDTIKSSPTLYPKLQPDKIRLVSQPSYESRQMSQSVLLTSVANITIMPLLATANGDSRHCDTTLFSAHLQQNHQPTAQ
ncbi:unnamed protein product [Protopolystoma xenopodis]|uniref:C2H2-type domain-containing protein n=1 Tax=Protopolystoma xenopodis TaxID=117903 RepID=A0A3S5BRD9_9PLAT|nr:unnamed protein product [Protopolystoma xenopodis]